ncbi:MAG: hypothetical protein J5829_04340 [Lachnospiraceae bacterium]|nr:hypothetical protein [Lachnospiraceae bacterium]
MGTWGMGLYDDDFACDIKDDYLQGLQVGKNNTDITNEMIQEYCNDKDLFETILFWIVLADIQWEYGRLLPDVKERALFYLDDPELMSGLLSEYDKLYEIKKEAFKSISNKIKKKMPEPTKIRKHRLYKCKWNIGDIFQYKIMGKDAGIYNNRYIYFIKCGEGMWYPGHICPQIYVFRGIFEHELNMEELKENKVMPQFFIPKVYKENKEEGIYCRLLLLNTSERIIPYNRMKYLCNTIFKDISKYEYKDAMGVRSHPIEWKCFDSEIMNNWEKWKDHFEYIDEKYDLSII